MKMTRIAIMLAMLASIAACQTPLYRPVSTGPVAELTVGRADGAKAGRLWPYLFRDAECSGRHHIGMLDHHSDDTLTTTIAARPDTLIEFGDYDITTRTSCDVKLLFNAVEGARYKATWSRTGSQCFARLERFVTTDGKEGWWVRDATVKRVYCDAKPSFL
ncbi:hypothetical protein [Undibacterium sp. TJN19]|uniref:hypothetical protein n=1 Tax=Undibacterium sp. TJN19 TaxID=3413055 RepID=UPI003BF0B6B5